MRDDTELRAAEQAYERGEKNWSEVQAVQDRLIGPCDNNDGKPGKALINAVLLCEECWIQAWQARKK